MPSPFPGMDPWLEGEETFRDLHASLIIYLREALNAALPAGYVATGNQLVWVDDQQRREPDVSLFGRDRPPNGQPEGGVATLPGMLAIGDDLAPEPTEEPYLEIVSATGRRLVAAIEVLSLSNKRPGDAGRKAYQEKQTEFRLSNVHLVEIDLHRGGTHTTAIPLPRLQRALGTFDYHVAVTVGGTPSRFHAAPIRLTDPLPTIGIPLDPGVPPVTVALQPLLDRAYDTGRYTQLVRYTQPPSPPLTPEQQAWAEGVLRAKGLFSS